MAKTYYAEGRQITNLLRAVFGILSIVFYFYVVPGLHWGFLFGPMFVGLIVAEIIGARWTKKRRAEKQAKKTSIKGTTIKTSASSATSKSINKTKVLSDEQLIKADVNSLSGTDFERLMEMYFKDQGYAVQRIGGSGDHEVDLIIKGKEGYKIAVQCKRWKQDVGNDIVLRLKAGKQVHGCYDAWIITTSNYTKAAKEAAEKLNIKLINGLMLDSRLKNWKAKKIQA